MSRAIHDDSVPTPNPYGVDEHGREIGMLQLNLVIMGTPAENGQGYEFLKWDGRDPSEKSGCFVFILSKLGDGDIYPYITIGDLIKAQKIDLSTDNTLIPTACLLGTYIGDTTIGTYLYPPSSMPCPRGKINLQQAQTFLPNLMKASRILMRVFENPYKNTFWYKFNKGESSNINLDDHLIPLHKRLKIPSKFIHSTSISNISPIGDYYQHLHDYIPRNPDAQFVSSYRRHRPDSLSSSGHIKRSRDERLLENSNILNQGGKSRRKLKTTNKRTNRRTTKRRNTRTNRRRNTKKRRN